jgi:hypothetical protein
MDLKFLKEEALQLTARAFAERGGVAPDQDGEEWENEYRRQFEALKRRQATAPAAVAAKSAPAPALVEEGQPEWPRLSGPPAEQRWALALRAQRLKEIRSPEMRRWLGHAWLAAKDWIGTRDLNAIAFQRRVESQYAGHRRQAAADAGASQSEQQRKAAAAAAIQAEIRAAGITAEGLIGLIDISPRTRPAPIKGKIADLALGERSLRIFETGHDAVLMVIDKALNSRTEYAIERDDGLVADLRLFARDQSA